MRFEATRELLAAPADVWALLAEPRHLPDWWTAYSAVRPDRRGLAVGARWEVARSTADPGLIRRPGSDGLIVITAVEPESYLAWRDVQQGIEVGIRIEPASAETTLATVSLKGSWWRVHVEGMGRVPTRSLGRLHALCQTAASL